MHLCTVSISLCLDICQAMKKTICMDQHKNQIEDPKQAFQIEDEPHMKRFQTVAFAKVAI